MEQLVGFDQIFDFWVGLAQGLWKTRDKLIPSGGTPEENPTHTMALNHTLDTLIVIAVSDYGVEANSARYSSTTPYTEPQDHTSILRLLDLMALTHKTQELGRLITLVSKPQGDLLVKYQRLITPLIPKLRVRYQHYGSSGFPILDPFLRALVGRWLQDLLGIPSKQPEAVVKRVDCGCEYCEKVNEFLQSGAVMETFEVAHKKKRTHMESKLKNTLSGDVTFAAVTVKKGAPQGLQVTKTEKMLKMSWWIGRVESTRAFLALIGTPDELVRIMGERYQNLEAALAGTKLYKMDDPTLVVVRVEGSPAANASTTRAAASGTQNGPVVAGVKRKAEDCGDEIDMT